LVLSVQTEPQSERAGFRCVRANQVDEPEHEVLPKAVSLSIYISKRIKLDILEGMDCHD